MYIAATATPPIPYDWASSVMYVAAAATAPPPHQATDALNILPVLLLASVHPACQAVPALKQRLTMFVKVISWMGCV